MILQIYYRNDGTGILPDEARSGDCLLTYPDTFVPGDVESKTFLWLKIPDPPNKNAVTAAVTDSEYEADGSGSDRVKRFRKFYINWAQRFTAAEIALITDPTVAFGVIEGKFTYLDFRQKN